MPSASAPDSKVLLRAQNEAESSQIDLESSKGPIFGAGSAQDFEPFFITKLSGTGLGLAIAYNISAVSCAGLLQMETAEKVRFTLVLPRAALRKTPRRRT
jgi:C4-dicarboxylate-specific signal transduction histidine kinase